MPSGTHEFLFDTAFGFGEESVFTQIDEDEGKPFPPVEGYFLLLTNLPLQLMDGQNMALM